MHIERHRINRVGWLRASVLGANDGLLSTASLVLGVAAAHGTHKAILISGIAGLVAGAMSMAAGEYVSVSSQADSEASDLERERNELATDPVGERRELQQIYVSRGLTAALAAEVATQLMTKDALAAHARDELGIADGLTARPVQAAFASAASFAAGAAVPLIVGALTSQHMIPLVVLTSLLCLMTLGGLAARAGGSSVLKGSARVTFWGVLAMAVTFAIGAMVGSAGPTR
jgi:VIT1/CCC1 family predicted Fe2+/Mn2+ transporter